MYTITNHVREELRQGPGYLITLNRLMKMLEVEKDLDIYCAHEAGHIIYFLQMGAKDSEFEYCGPTIYFDVAIGNFNCFPCAVGKPKLPVRNNADLKSFAKISVAGGVCEKALEGSTDTGDKDDRHKFRVAFAGALTDGIIPTQTEQDMWEWAQAEVRLELANESSKMEARRIAKDIKRKCFQASV